MSSVKDVPEGTVRAKGLASQAISLFSAKFILFSTPSLRLRRQQQGQQKMYHFYNVFYDMDHARDTNGVSETGLPSQDGALDLA